MLRYLLLPSTLTQTLITLWSRSQYLSRLLHATQRILFYLFGFPSHHHHPAGYSLGYTQWYSLFSLMAPDGRKSMIYRTIWHTLCGCHEWWTGGIWRPTLVPSNWLYGVAVPHVGAGWKGNTAVLFCKGLVTQPFWLCHPGSNFRKFSFLTTDPQSLICNRNPQVLCKFGTNVFGSKTWFEWSEAFYSNYLSHSVWLFICFSTAILMSLITTWGCFIRHGFYRSSLSNIWKLLNLKFTWPEGFWIELCLIFPS